MNLNVFGIFFFFSFNEHVKRKTLKAVIPDQVALNCAGTNTPETTLQVREYYSNLAYISSALLKTESLQTESLMENNAELIMNCN